MPTLKQLRLEARLSHNALAKLAKIDRITVERAEEGTPVRDIKAYAIVQALNERLGTRYTMEQIEGLNIL